MKRRNLIPVVIYSLIVIFILYFILLPVLSVIIYGLYSGVKSEIVFDSIRRAIFYLRNSIMVAVMVTAISTFFGIVMSFTLNRLRFIGRRSLQVFALLPLINPPFVGSIAFIMLFGRYGLITHRLLGLNVSPFGWHGIVFLQILGLGSMAYVFISSSIQKVDVSLEEAARNLGASEIRVFFTITLPMMIPEISNAALLIFLASMADFTTPIIIGGKFQTLASNLYIQIIGLYDMQTATISGMFLLIPCVLAFIVQYYYIRRRTYYTDNSTTTSIEYKNIRITVKALLICITIGFVGIVLLQYVFILVGALTKNWGHDYTFTFEHFKTIFGKNLTPYINSVKLSFFSASLSAFLGVLLAYLLNKKKLYLRSFVDFIAVLPAAVPGILFGIGYLVTFKYPLFGIGRFILLQINPPVLLGTSIIVYLICIARYMNVGVRSGQALLEHIDPDMENAALNLGASEARAFFTVMIPLLRDGLYASYLKNFAATMTTLGAIIFLLLPKNKVAVQQIFQIMTSSSIGEAATMALLLSFLSLILLGIFYLIFNYNKILRKWKEGRLFWK